MGHRIRSSIRCFISSKIRVYLIQLSTSYNGRYTFTEKIYNKLGFKNPWRKKIKIEDEEDGTGNYAISIRFTKFNLQNAYLTLVP